MKFSELVYGEATEVADALHGDNPPETIAELRAALTNALRRIDTLEKENRKTIKVLAEIAPP